MKKLLLNTAVLFALTSSTQGSMISWTNPAGGSFFDPNNWHGGVVPRASDTASFAIGGPANYLVNLTEPITNENLFIEDNATLDLAGESYTLTSTDPTNPSVQIGGTDAVLNLQSTGSPGTLSSNDVTLASLAGQKTTVNLNDPNATWNIGGSLYVGGSETAIGGTAAINVEAGTLDIAGSLRIYPGSSPINLDGGRSNCRKPQRLKKLRQTLSPASIGLSAR